jgi:23S rRNA (guanosine2251-2'-O)-methyltransferase
MEEAIWGRNAVREALQGGRPVNKVLIAGGAPGARLRARVREIVDRARQIRVPVQVVDREVLDRIAGGASHQGIVAYLSPKAYLTLEELLEQVLGRQGERLPEKAEAQEEAQGEPSAKVEVQRGAHREEEAQADTYREGLQPEQAASRQQDPLLVILAGWEDPRNLGAMLRSAEAAGVDGVIIPERRAAPLTGAVAKTAAGALEHLQISRVGNLSRTLEKLKKEGFWVVGAAAGTSRTYYEADLTGPLAVVIGGEDKGLGHLEQGCDLVVRIPMRGRLGSLNAAVAGSVLLFEVLRQRAMKSVP